MMKISKLCARILFSMTSVIHIVSSLDCSPPSGSIYCECTLTTAECFGLQTNISEIHDILTNISYASTVILKINDLQFDPNFTFENSSIKNLTLGFGLEKPPSDIFAGLGSSLVGLNLQNNSIDNIDDLFSTLFSLTELYLDINNVHELKANMFINLKDLKYLSIAKNNITEIGFDVFQNLSSFHTLILSYNNISWLKNLNVKSTSLNVLKIDNCLIEGSLQEDTFSLVPNLEELDMSYNKLSDIKRHSLSALKNLKLLNLSHNEIENLTENAFSELRNLTLLDLRGNQIKILKQTSFARLFNLKYLDLSGNKLQAVLCEYTTDFISLEEIYLQDNQIKTFTSGTFFYSPILKVLDISGNNFECSCPLTDTVHYLIENSTMDSEDLKSVSCVIPSTLSQVSIADYKSSTCTEPEPCKKIEDDESEDDEYDYDDGESTTVKTTISPMMKTSEESTTTITSKATESTLLSTDNITETGSQFPSVDNVTDTVHSTINNPANTESPSPTVHNETESPFPTINSVADTESPSTTVTNETENPFLNVDVTSTTTETMLIPQNSTDVPHSSEILYTESSGSTTMSPSDITESSSVKFTAVTAPRTVATPTPVSTCSSLDLSTSSISSDSEETIILRNFSYDDNTFCLKWTVGNILGMKRCIIRYTYASGTKFENTKCPKYNKEVMEWSKTEKIFKICINIYGDTNIASCDKTVAVKTTPASTSLFTTPAPVSEKTTVSDTAFSSQTSNNYSSTLDTTSINASESTPIPSTIWYTESSTERFIPTEKLLTKYITTDKFPTKLITTDKFPIKYETTDKFPTKYITTDKFPTKLITTDKFPTKYETTDKFPTKYETTEKFVTTVETFSITALNMYFNNSKLAYIQWSVSKEEPFDACNLTLRVTTQLFGLNEGTFECKNNTHRLRNVKEDEIFNICLVSHHDISGEGEECRHSLSLAAATTSDDESLNGLIIPLICLLVLLGILLMFVVFRNISKKKKVTNKYDVRAEEKKYEQRVKIRPTSLHEESVRFSYIAHENQELI